MKYTKDERLEIGRQVYTHELSLGEAANKYDLNTYTIRDYMRDYRDKNSLPPMSDGKEQLQVIRKNNKAKYDDLQGMSKSELIDEVIKARVEAERSKKGYQVKGGGQEKEFISLSNSNTK